MTKTKNRIAGLNVYKDKHNRDVYYDRLTKKAYIINPSDVNQYNFYSRRFFIPIIAFVLLFSLKIGNIELGYAGAAGIALIIGIITEAFFRFRFLKSLSAVPNFQPKEKPDYFDQLANAGNKQDLMIRSLLYFALGIVLIVFGYLSEFEIFEWIICIAFSLGAIIMGIINLIAVLRKK